MDKQLTDDCNALQLFGTDDETYGRDSNGRCWILQPADAGWPNGAVALRTDEIPATATEVEDGELLDLLETLDSLEGVEVHEYVYQSEIKK